MSAFLGKIHYWLFNKILWFENLEENIILFAQIEGLDITSIKRELEYKFGKKLENKNLEEIIDLDNIHGWLQNRIHISEKRMASWIKVISENGKESMEKLEKIFKEQGVIAAKEAKKEKEYTNAFEIYNCINNYILDGMPCDRVNVLTTSDDNIVVWERRVCVHKEIWENEGVDVQTFYNLRDLWIKSFVEELNPKFEYVVENDGKYKIVLK